MRASRTQVADRLSIRYVPARLNNSNALSIVLCKNTVMPSLPLPLPPKKLHLLTGRTRAELSFFPKEASTASKLFSPGLR